MKTNQMTFHFNMKRSKQIFFSHRENELKQESKNDKELLKKRIRNYEF